MNDATKVIYNTNVIYLMLQQVNNILMFDNFFESDYHSYDKIYTNQQTNNHIYIGDAQSATNHDFLINSKIKTKVVTAAKNMDHIIVGEGIKHIRYSLLDGKNQNIFAFFRGFYELVQESIKNGSILAHCAAGISRSATLVISYIMRKQKMSFKDALSFVRQARPTVLPNLGFQRQLKLYQQTLRSSKNEKALLRRREVKTSEGGVRESWLRIELLPAVKNERRGMESLTEKDIKILKIYHNVKKNHPILALNHRSKILKTQTNQLKHSQLQPLLPIRSKIQGRDVEQWNPNKINRLKSRNGQSGRGYTLDNSKGKRFKF